MNPMDVRMIVRAAYLKVRGGVGKCCERRWCDDIPDAPGEPGGEMLSADGYQVIDDVSRVAVRVHRR